MITQEELKGMELEAPRYEFVEAGEGNEETLPPVKRQVASIREIAETFTVYQVYQRIAALGREIKDKEAILEAVKTKKQLYEAELALIEKSLHVEDMNKQFEEEVAKEVQAKVDEEEKKTNG